jgi:hypothetical protein
VTKCLLSLFKVGHGENAIAATVESEMSRHFVVITNEIQWQGSAGSLLKRDAFDGQVPAAHPTSPCHAGDGTKRSRHQPLTVCLVQLEIMWPQFANALQRHVLKATKQDPVRPARCMSGYDLKYMRAKFFGTRVSHPSRVRFFLHRAHSSSSSSPPQEERR